jgi:hypothetical protein
MVETVPEVKAGHCFPPAETDNHEISDHAAISRSHLRDPAPVF